ASPTRPQLRGGWPSPSASRIWTPCSSAWPSRCTPRPRPRSPPGREGAGSPAATGARTRSAHGRLAVSLLVALARSARARIVRTDSGDCLASDRRRRGLRIAGGGRRGAGLALLNGATRRLLAVAELRLRRGGPGLPTSAGAALVGPR